jgi:drug/metabolite transporter (DMT)-like permease
MNGLIGGIISAIGFGTADALIKKALMFTSIPRALTMSTISGIACLVVLVIVSGSDEAINSTRLLTAFGVSICEIVAYLSTYKAFDSSNVSVAKALGSTYPLFITIIAVIFLNESFNTTKVLLVIVIVVGAMFTVIDWRGVFRDGFDSKDLSKGLGWILLMIVTAVIYFPLIGEFTSQGSWQFRLLIVKIFSAIILISIFRFGLGEKIIPPRKVLPLTIFLGFLEIVGWSGFVWAFSTTTGQISVIVAALNSSVLITAIVSYFVLKEKLSKPQYFGMILIVLGLTGLASV